MYAITCKTEENETSQGKHKEGLCHCHNLLFLWRDSNDKLSAACILGRCPRGAVSEQFYVGQDHFVVRDVVLSVLYFGGYIATISIDRSVHVLLSLLIVATYPIHQN